MIPRFKNLVPFSLNNRRLKLLESFLAQDPANTALCFNMGLIYESMGNAEHARLLFRQVVDKEPEGSDRRRRAEAKLT
jgi:cytochrome c-type biogenesis protein CcmH/NrfG